ncbi:hypothetical protein BJ165DRAFT_1492622 [Panaeolus papilionaceus]|nr:hypothetical protein BJ165DRAFT_1492622 [Panaeolus papilionaceus]
MPLDLPRLFLASINNRPLFSADTKSSTRSDGYTKLGPGDSTLVRLQVQYKPAERKAPEKRLLSMPIVPFNSPVVTPCSSFVGLICSRRSSSLHTHVRNSFPMASAELPRSDSFNISLESETSASEEDNDAKAIAALKVNLCQPLRWNQNTESNVDERSLSGLGIEGLTRKDGSAAFDGLGIVANPFDDPSETLIQEALLTFMEGRDREQLLETIVECPWLERKCELPTLSSNGLGPSEEDRLSRLRSHNRFPSWPPLLTDHGAQDYCSK